MTDLTYQLLLELYRGKASVVEQISDEERAALRIETPLTQYIRTAAHLGVPRHIFLTGNAGDGKTFAVLTADPVGFVPVYDASAKREDADTHPIENLATALTAALDQGHRLLVAINRGQLERLETYASTRGGQLATIVSQARRYGRLQASWSGTEESSEVALIDLGLVDTLSSEILDRMLDKLCAAGPVSGMSAESTLAFTRALEALRQSNVRLWIRRVLETARAAGHHATMRQLWSFLSYLATGARSLSSNKPVGLSDSVGVRLFSEEAEGPLFELARDLLDPATTPDPVTTRKALLGTLLESLRSIPGLQDLLADADDVSGRALLRAVAVHTPTHHPPRRFEDTFGRLQTLLRKMPPGWQEAQQVTDTLLTGVYRQLGLSAVASVFPAWQVLCYDSSRLQEAALIAVDEIDSSKIRLALPRPAPACEEALGGAWRAPYLWLSLAGPEGSEPGILRLTPNLFSALYGDAGDVVLTEPELLTLRRWVGRITTARRPSQSLMVGHHGAQRRLRLQRDQLLATTRIFWEGGDGH